jgi:hypothetical protein
MFRTRLAFLVPFSQPVFVVLLLSVTIAASGRPSPINQGLVPSMMLVPLRAMIWLFEVVFGHGSRSPVPWLTPFSYYDPIAAFSKPRILKSRVLSWQSSSFEKYPSYSKAVDSDLQTAELETWGMKNPKDSQAETWESDAHGEEMGWSVVEMALV